MSAALFDPDDIMREVRASASSQLGAKTANLLKSARGFSSLADLAALPAIGGDNLTVCVVQKIGRVRLFEPFEEPAGPSAPRRAPLASLNSAVPEGCRERLRQCLGQYPKDVPTERWAVLCNGVERFAQEWAANAMCLGWTFAELFALAKPFANVSLQGAAWFVGDSTVTAITGDAITLRTAGGATTRIYRKPRA